MAGTAKKGMLRQLSIEGAGGEALLQGGERAARLAELAAQGRAAEVLRSDHVER